MDSNTRNNPQQVARISFNDNLELLPNYPLEPRPEPTTQVRGDPWQSVTALQLGLHPRSFGELHAERLYLLEMLQQHDRRASGLFMMVPLVEDKIWRTGDPEEQKRAKKHRVWLRHRITDTVEEEKKILARLSELHVEIQCRERWSRVDKQREMMNISLQHAPDYTGFSIPSSAPWRHQMYPMPPQLPTPHHPCYVPPHIYYEGPIPTPGIQSSQNWNHETPAHEKNTSDKDFGSGAYELDDTAIDVTQDSEPRRRSQSLGDILESRSKKRRIRVIGRPYERR
ncbi:hypothetical protein F4805DRAFT_453873 [Annulohypoxylon moriforme]|nr:hypothetical protein F4805DRAFT_453873 [Annulohypoxylon moriforme]